ncbi:MAG TPA: NTP transferase domain-containing protein [Polyangiaceae bacterium]|nr:NTP transferase domain-containing protein [Polyangiaceae bacterium]
MRILVGILVGGRATRFGGIAKGLLPAPDSGEPLVGRLARLCREAVGAEVVLVGRAASYEALGLPLLEDEPSGIGPLGGLSSLVSEAMHRGSAAIAVAGDLPYVTSELVARVAAFAPEAAAVAPRPGGTWQPLFARYDPGPCLPVIQAALADGVFKARAVLERLGDRAVELALDSAEASLLVDWDSPEDVSRRR